MHRPLCIVLIVWLFSTELMASKRWSLNMAEAIFGDIHSEQLSVNAIVTDTGLGIEAEIARITLPAPLHKLDNLKIRCTVLSRQHQQWQCQSGELQFYHPQLGQQDIDFSAEVNPESKHYQVRLSNLSLANSPVEVTLQLEQQHWQLEAVGQIASLADFIQALQPYLTAAQWQQWRTWQASGEAAINITAQGHNKTIKTAQVDIELSQINISDELGRFVAEQGTGKLVVNGYHHNNQWQWQTEVELFQGQAYIDPVFFDLELNPIQLDLAGTWNEQNQTGQIEFGRFVQQDIAQLVFTAAYANKTWSAFEVEMPSTALSSLYTQWLQPFTVGTASDSLLVDGHVEWQFKQQGENYSLQGQLHGVAIEDQTARFSITGLTGPFSWTNMMQPLPLKLSWQQAQLYSIPIGQSELSANTHSEGMTLTQPWQVPILDGDLHIHDFSLNTAGNQGASWQFEGVMTPISMPALSEQLGWPILQGKLSGIIPKVRYQQQQVAVDGALMVKVFDGTTVIHDLTLNQLFGPIPELTANIDITGLDLDTMTSAFDFGKITGTLEGKIAHLRLANWQPVYFDAYLATPEQDDKPHRISQRAVNNLSNLGGGASGVLSRSVLRFFEDFSYHRLGLSCRLRNERCEMTGVSPAERGYYIVEGGGLPPIIDVIGHTKQVNWPELLDRLKAVNHSPQAVME